MNYYYLFIVDFIKNAVSFALPLWVIVSGVFSVCFMIKHRDVLFKK